MQGRLSRACVVTTLLATLLIPAVVSSAGSSQKLKKIEEQLDALRTTIKREAKQAGSLRDRIDVVSRSITQLQIQVAKLERQIRKIEGDVEAAQGRIDATQARMDKIRKLASAQAVALYKGGATDTLDALLDSTSIAELDERVAFLGVAAKKNTDALIKFGRLKLTIEDQKRDLFRHKQALDARLAERDKVLNAERDLQADLSDDLATLRKRLKKHRNREGNLEKAAATITARIQAAQASSPVPNIGAESASGFIWPLNGPVTSPYGYRWGRMHTGIDIDGYTGQPIVASKGGRVILASSYSGYGNTVIVDHGGGVATLYAHMSAFSVSNGQSVSQGTVVGNVGCTGSCTGDHLHFEIRINGDPVDPMPYLP